MPTSASRAAFALVMVVVALVPAPAARAQTDATVATVATVANVAAVPAEIVLRAAALVYARELARARAGGGLDADRGQIIALRHMLQPLLVGATALRSETKSWRWEITVETRSEPVLYCLPGGKILVSTGFIDRPRLTPAEQGAALAHAIAHALLGHDADEATARLAREGNAASPDPNRVVLKLAEILARISAAEPHITADERAADTLALELMARSGADPRVSVETWRKLARSGGATPPAFLALHQTWPERYAELEARMPAMTALYETTLRDRIAPASVALPPPAAGRR